MTLDSPKRHMYFGNLHKLNQGCPKMYFEKKYCFCIGREEPQPILNGTDIISENEKAWVWDIIIRDIDFRDYICTFIRDFYYSCYMRSDSKR